jgi:hypothetical protein
MSQGKHFVNRYAPATVQLHRRAQAPTHPETRTADDYNGGRVPDTLIPSAAGQALLAAAASNAVNANWIGAASAGNPTVYSSNAVTMVGADRCANIIPTAAATATLPDCLGVTGAVYQITNLSGGANTITFGGMASGPITGSATLA